MGIDLIKNKKVEIFDRNICKRFGIIVSGIGVVLPIVLIFVSIPEKYKILTGLIFVMILILVYLMTWLYANKLTNTSVTVGVTSVEIKAGDIFEQDGLKAIAFNEYFDTQVDDKIIAKKSLNGQVIDKFFTDVNELNQKIEADKYLNSPGNILKENIEREGKGTRYKLGSSILVDEFIFTAFTKFSDRNEAQLTMQEYIDFLLSFWNEINRLYAQRAVTVPIFGSGITRFKNGFEDININELLKIMVWTFKISKIKFVYPAKLTIIIPEGRLKEINLFEIKENE